MRNLRRLLRENLARGQGPITEAIHSGWPHQRNSEEMTVMKALRLILLLQFSLCTFGQSVPQNGAEAGMETLRTLLRGGTIAKVQVLHLPDSALTRVAVTPGTLRSIASDTKTFSVNIGATFDPSLSGIAAKLENHPSDLRWGVLFYDAQGQEVASVFVDKFGRYGYLNGQTVSFNAGALGTDLAGRLHMITGIKR